jgi:RecB family exonuclease
VKVVALTPAQQDVLDLLRRVGGDRPDVGGDLRDGLRQALEGALARRVGGLTEPLFVSKSGIGRVLACEEHHLAEEAAPFEWTAATARGVVAHKAIQLAVGREGVAPLRLVDDALERLTDDPNERVATFLLGLTPAATAELRASVGDMVTSFAELWPPLVPAWRPQTESSRRVELFDGMVVLSGRIDLSLGAPEGSRAGRVIVDLKTGRAHAGHVEELRYYALLDTLRVGVPPFSLVAYYLESGRFVTEDVTEGVLESALRRTLDAVGRMLELRLGLRSASRTAGPACGWCRLRDTCPDAAARLLQPVGDEV